MNAAAMVLADLYVEAAARESDVVRRAETLLRASPLATAYAPPQLAADCLLERPCSLERRQVLEVVPSDRRAFPHIPLAKTPGTSGAAEHLRLLPSRDIPSRERAR